MLRQFIVVVTCMLCLHGMNAYSQSPAGNPGAPPTGTVVDSGAVANVRDTSTRPVQLIYTTVLQHQSHGSHDVVNDKVVIKSSVDSFRSALTGRLAGLHTLQTSGVPGADGAILTLRGQTPVIIVDGVVGNLTN